MKTTKLLLITAMLFALFSCSKDDDNNTTPPIVTTKDTATISVTIKNSMKYAGVPEAIWMVKAYDMNNPSDTDNMVALDLNGIDTDTTVVRRMLFNKTGSIKIVADILHAGTVPHCPYRMVTVKANTPLYLHFNESY